jgi:archaellum component FlaC
MTENVTNELIFSVLQQMQADMSELKFDVRDLKDQMTMVEEHLGSSIIAISGVNSRLDRLNDRVERIETRLELLDHR